MPAVPPVAGKVAVVTGAARGVGAELAGVLASRGVSVALLGLEPEQLQAVADRIGHGAKPWVCDVTDSTSLNRIAAEVLEHYGRIDILVANAGVASGGTLVGADMRAYERTIEVNLLGSIRTVRAFLPAIIASRGYVLQVASLAAMMAAPMMSAYAASKSGVEAFAHALRGEVHHRGVDVGVAYLTWTDTEMVRGADRVAGLAEARASLPWPFNKTAPLGPAVERLADGIARRSAHVYGQGWLRAIQPFRPYLPVMGRLADSRIKPAEAAFLAAGDAAGGLVGAGGAADGAVH